MDALTIPLIETLKTSIPMLVRSAPSTGDYLEGVLSRQDLARCAALLNDALGPAAKDFGQDAKLEPPVQRAIDARGGIRREQCLYVKSIASGQVVYAALWPWASDPTRITLKVGIFQL